MTSKTAVTAEAGVNHNGDVGLACQLVRAAAKAGADTVTSEVPIRLRAF